MATAAATLLAGSAFAQGTGNLGAQQPIHPGLQAPSYQQGSGQRAGGPANELNSNGPMTTGTIVVPVPAEPMPPSGVVGSMPWGDRRFSTARARLPAVMSARPSGGTASNEMQLATPELRDRALRVRVFFGSGLGQRVDGRAGEVEGEQILARRQAAPGPAAPPPEPADRPGALARDRLRLLDLDGGEPDRLAERAAASTSRRSAEITVAIFG